jgi:hypothetical protein
MVTYCTSKIAGRHAYGTTIVPGGDGRIGSILLERAWPSARLGNR